MTCMARGPSGRLVIEVDPLLKRDLHAALAAAGLTLKDWLVRQAADYIATRRQPSLPGIIRYPGADDQPSLRIAEDTPLRPSPPTPQP